VKRGGLGKSRGDEHEFSLKKRGGIPLSYFWMGQEGGEAHVSECPARKTKRVRSVKSLYLIQKKRIGRTVTVLCCQSSVVQGGGRDAAGNSTLAREAAENIGGF